MHKIWRKKKTEKTKQNQTKPKIIHSLTTRHNIFTPWLYKFPILLLCILLSPFKNEEIFTWLMRAKARAETHEHFPSHQKAPPFLRTSFKMPTHYKKESFRNTDSNMFIFCFHVLSKLNQQSLDINTSSIKTIAEQNDL